jgi:hypothetical protein
MGSVCDRGELGEPNGWLVFCRPEIEQAREPPDGQLLPGPDEVEWKRFVRVQRRLGGFIRWDRN